MLASASASASGFSLEQRVDAAIAVARILFGQSLDALLQRLVCGIAHQNSAHATTANSNQCSGSALRQGLVSPDQNGALQMQYGFAFRVGRSNFFDNTSSRASLSKLRSATCFLEPPVFLSRFVDGHGGVLGAPFVEAVLTDTAQAAQFGDGGLAAFGLVAVK